MKFGINRYSICCFSSGKNLYKIVNNAFKIIIMILILRGNARISSKSCMMNWKEDLKMYLIKWKGG